MTALSHSLKTLNSLCAWDEDSKKLLVKQKTCSETELIFQTNGVNL